VPPATAALLAIALSALPFDALAARPNVTCAPDADPATLANEGKELGKTGKNIEAYEKLVCAYRISQSYTVSANLGLIELALGLHADAANHMSRAVRDWPLDDEKKKKVRISRDVITCPAVVIRRFGGRDRSEATLLSERSDAG
jgi:hypothetical protein